MRWRRQRRTKERKGLKYFNDTFSDNSLFCSNTNDVDFSMNDLITLDLCKAYIGRND